MKWLLHPLWISEQSCCNAEKSLFHKLKNDVYAGQILSTKERKQLEHRGSEAQRVQSIRQVCLLYIFSLYQSPTEPPAPPAGCKTEPPQPVSVKPLGNKPALPRKPDVPGDGGGKTRRISGV